MLLSLSLLLGIITVVFLVMESEQKNHDGESRFSVNAIAYFYAKLKPLGIATISKKKRAHMIHANRTMKRKLCTGGVYDLA